MRLSFNQIEQQIESKNTTEEKVVQNKEEQLLQIKQEAKPVSLPVVPVSTINYNFIVVLNVYTSKNNVSWVLSDLSKKQIFYKLTGGNSTKRGYLKNSQKVSTTNFDQLIEVLKNLNPDLVLCYLRSANLTRKHKTTTRMVSKLLETLGQHKIRTPPYIINNTKISVSKIRVKGGKKGRR